MFNGQRRLLLLVFLGVALLLWQTVVLSEAASVPDTAQTKCYDAAGVVIACTGTGQDGEYNINPMSFTDNGNGTVTDNVTGLLWQKEDDNTTRTWANAGTYCESLTLGGQSGWRLPVNKELMSIFEYTTENTQTYSTTYFTNIKTSPYWSSVTLASDTNYAWQMSFISSLFNGFLKSATDAYVRCVRGVQASPSFKDNGNGTVTDNVTGLIWQQGDQGTMAWANAPSSCKGLSLGGQSDWRLPNIKELASITDDTKYNPSIDTTYFPSTKRENFENSYWSSTTAPSNAGVPYAYQMDYKESKIELGGTSYISANVKIGAKYNPNYTRCVRGGQSGSIQNNCAATVSSSLVVHIPIVTYGGANYWADLQYNSADSTLTVANAGTVSDMSSYGNCTASTLSTEFKLHVPVLMLNGVSYWADLQYNGSAFVVAGVGQN